MIVRVGITSLYSRKRLPEFSFDDFKRMAYGCAIPCAYTVAALLERGVTPNFHTAVLENQNCRVHLLGHSTYPIFAFAEPREVHSCQLVFRDELQISEVLKQSYPHVEVATLEELSSPISKSDLEKLDRAEIDQIKYWKPSTIGELAFNWWD